jgi:hypothetical protein
VMNLKVPFFFATNAKSVDSIQRHVSRLTSHQCRKWCRRPVRFPACINSDVKPSSLQRRQRMCLVIGLDPSTGPDSGEGVGESWRGVGRADVRYHCRKAMLAAFRYSTVIYVKEFVFVKPVFQLDIELKSKI